MPGKGKKGKKAPNNKEAVKVKGNESSDKEEEEENGNGEKKKKGKKGKSKGKSSKFQGDIFNEAAMENAYYVCHNIQVKKLN